MDLNLNDRVALVTGASQGIGAAVAAQFAAEGCHVHIAARSGDRLESLASELRARHGVAITPHSCDLSRHEDVLALAAACPAPDILVNDAGAIPAGGLLDIDLAKWKAAWDLKVFGYIGLTQAILPRMFERRSGVIVCVIGATAFRPNPDYIAGCMANVALNMFVSCLGGQAFNHGVRVCAVNPGATESERQVYFHKDAARRKLGDPERYTELLKDHPAGRIATCEEIANTVAFLASDKSSYTSAAAITIDAGYRG